jgi:hypothetical protein
MGLHLCVVWTEDTRTRAAWSGACQSTIPKTEEEAWSSFSNPFYANHSTQWRLVSHQFTVCWKLDFLLLYAKQCFFFETTQVFWKGNIPSQILQIRTENWVSREGQFSKKGIFRHNYFKFSKLWQKTGFLGRVSPDSCLLATHLQSSVKRDSLVKLKSG